MTTDPLQPAKHPAPPSKAAVLLPHALARGIVHDIAELRRCRFVLRNFVANQLKVRYQRSVLGFMWTLINPILMMTVLSVVFSQVMHRPVEVYVVYLFSGMIPWHFLAACVDNGSKSLISHEFLIRKVNVQKLIFPLSDVLVAGVNMCFAMAALFLILQVFRPPFHLQLILLPAGLVVLTLFSFGMALVAMTLVTRFRDFQHMIGVFMYAFYFLCPIIYYPEHLGKYRWLLDYNPMAHIQAIFRCAFTGFTTGSSAGAAWPTPENWIWAWGSGLAAVAIGYVLYKYHENDYIFLL